MPLPCQRTDAVCRRKLNDVQPDAGDPIRDAKIGLKSGSAAFRSTYSGFMCHVAPWADVEAKKERTLSGNQGSGQPRFDHPTAGQAAHSLFSPPAIPEAGASGDISFVDMEGTSTADTRSPGYNNIYLFHRRGSDKRPELAQNPLHLLPNVPQVCRRRSRRTLSRGGGHADGL